MARRPEKMEEIPLWALAAINGRETCYFQSRLLLLELLRLHGWLLLRNARRALMMIPKWSHTRFLF